MVTRHKKSFATIPSMETCLINNEHCSQSSARLRRGLCNAYYAQFRRELDRLPAEEQDEFDDYLVAQGRLLPSRQGQRDSDRVFADAVEEFRRDRIRAGSKAANSAAKKQLQRQDEKKSKRK